MTLSGDKLSITSTRELKFILGVGKAGLKTWKGKRLAEVRDALAQIEAELKRRGEKT